MDVYSLGIMFSLILRFSPSPSDFSLFCLGTDNRKPPSWPEELRELVQRMASYHPNDRPSVAQILEELDSML